MKMTNILIALIVCCLSMISCTPDEPEYAFDYVSLYSDCQDDYTDHEAVIFNDNIYVDFPIRIEGLTMFANTDYFVDRYDDVVTLSAVSGDRYQFFLYTRVEDDLYIADSWVETLNGAPLFNNSLYVCKGYTFYLEIETR